MSTQLTQDSVTSALVRAVPEFSEALDEHLEDTGGEVLPHLLFGDLTRFVITAHDKGSGELVQRTLRFLERAIRDGDQDVQDVVAASFIENIGVWEPAMASLVLILPPALRAQACAQGGPTDGWDLHDAGADIEACRSRRLAAGTEVSAEVICHHPFGLGVRIVAFGELGHLDIDAIQPARGTIVDPLTYPEIGSQIPAIVLGYSGQDQLRLRMISQPLDE